MAGRHHRYNLTVTWTGDQGSGTQSYAGYGRNHIISAPEKPDIAGSSDPAFRGDATRWNPEELLLASVSACHKLWYLHLCSANGISVMAYEDQAEAVMEEDPSGAGRFIAATLRPRVTIAAGDAQRAAELHEDAHRYCFVANSVSFPIRCEPEITAV